MYFIGNSLHSNFVYIISNSAQRNGDYDFASCDKYDGLGEMKLHYAEDPSGGVPTVGEIKPIADAIPTLASFWQFCKEIDIGIEGMTMRKNLLQPEQVKTVTGHLLIDWWKEGATNLKRKQLSNILEEHDIPASGNGKFHTLQFCRRFPHDKLPNLPKGHSDNGSTRGHRSI